MSPIVFYSYAKNQEDPQISDQVLKSFSLVELKTALYKARPEGRFYQNLVCIVSIICSELDMVKKYPTPRESTYTELIFSQKNQVSQVKGLCQNRQLEKCPKSSKNGQNRDFKPRIQDNQSTYNRNLMFITRIRQDIAIAKDVMKKYKKIAEICSKKSRKSWISSITLQQRSRDRPPGLIIFQKLFQKLPKRILITLAKNRIDCICCFFHEFFYRQRVGTTTPARCY